MNNSKVERARQKAMLFGQQFLQGDTGVFDQALGVDAMAAVMSTQAAGTRERIYPALDTLRLFVGQVLSADRAPVRMWWVGDSRSEWPKANRRTRCRPEPIAMRANDCRLRWCAR